MTLITFILFSNSYNAQLQSTAQAKTNSPTVLPSLPDDEKILQETIQIPELSYIETVPARTDNQADDMQIRTDNQTDDMQIWTVRSGDTFSEILQTLGVYSSFRSILPLEKEIKPLMKLKAGKSLHMRIENNELIKLIYKYSDKANFILRKEDKRYIAENYILPIENRETFISAVIEDSFYLSAKKAGMPDEIIIETADILAWDIDFILDIRKGDTFSVIYAEKYLYGEKLSNGDIIGVKFTNRGKTYHAIRHTLANGNAEYFSLDGRNVKKPFLRSPLKFTRVSSAFNPKRLHPILNSVRPHRGVDYAAPTGTPVYASADGKVIYRGWKAGYGNTVIIRHGNIYSTLYAHLSKFSSKARLSSRVKQGQTIAYVGMTGYATGPHLHYEFRVNKIHKNPLTVKFPDSKPMPTGQLKHFRQATTFVVKQLDTVSKQYADANGL